MDAFRRARTSTTPTKKQIVMSTQAPKRAATPVRTRVPDAMKGIEKDRTAISWNPAAAVSHHRSERSASHQRRTNSTTFQGRHADAPILDPDRRRQRHDDQIDDEGDGRDPLITPPGQSQQAQPKKGDAEQDRGRHRQPFLPPPGPSISGSAGVGSVGPPRTVQSIRARRPPTAALA